MRGLLASFALLGLAAVSWFGYQQLRTRLPSTPGQPYLQPAAPAVIEGVALYRDEAVLRQSLQTYGAGVTIRRLHALVPQLGSCHDPAHQAGRIAYELFGETAFQQCRAECHSGCYHGAMEAYFADKGTANLAGTLRTLCTDQLNPFFRHQCIHGMGHGLLAWADYDIFEALAACDQLPGDEAQRSCWTGMFMENVVGSLGREAGHQPKYLSDDTQYPCSIVPEKYKHACYFLQTSRMLALFGQDFAAIAQACAEAPRPYWPSCFESMGRDVGGNNLGDPEGMVAACRSAPTPETVRWCLRGAAQDTFWDPSGKDMALRVCRLLTDPAEQDVCYAIIGHRAPSLLEGTDLQDFCREFPEPYRARCAPPRTARVP
jgi:hypothetical protein